MAPDHDIHADIAAYLLGRLEPVERARFEAHLAECPQCRGEIAELRPAADAIATIAPPFDPPSGLRSSALGAVEAAAAAEQSVRRGQALAPRRRRPLGLRRFARPATIALAGALALAIAVFAGVKLGEENTGGPADALLAGKIELEGEMVSRDGVNEGWLVVRKQATGREVFFRSSSLPILPKGEYYELWFVGPGDSPSHPNRIPAGTFHPDAAGRTAVLLHAAVDPALYPRVEITAQPGPAGEAAVGQVVASLAKP